MSTDFYKMSDGLAVNYDRQIDMTGKSESLSDYVRRVVDEKGLTYRQIARRSGGLISHATVGDVIKNPHKDVTTETLKGLAKGLGVPKEEIFAVARGQRPIDKTEFKEHLLGSIFEKLSLASPRQRERAFVVLELLNESLDKDTEVSRR